MMNRTQVSIAIGAAFSAGLIGLAPEVLAQQQLERVEITGSSLRRADAETALPVTILRAEDLQKMGITSVEQAMRILPQNQSAQGAGASVGGTTAGASFVDLRGLGAATNSSGQRTLVLLNGRRVANQAYDSGAVDLNAIPMAAIDRIEVLRDGASAIYGTDAIGGVVNFILRREFKGVDVSAEYQNPEEYGGITKRASLTAGWGELGKEGWNIFGTIDWRNEEAVMAADRKFGSTGILPERGQFRTSGTTFPGTVSGFNPAAPNCRPPSSVWNGSACRYDFVRDIDLTPENEQLSFLLRGTVKLGGEHYISAEYLNSTSDNIARVAPTPLVGATIPSTSPYYPAGATGNIVNWRLTSAGKRTSEAESTAERMLIEANGVVAGWDYRAGLFQSKSESADTFTNGYIKAPQIEAGIASGLLNPFGPQTTAGQAYIDANKVIGEVLSAEGKVTGVDARVTKDLFQMAGGAAPLAIGVEWRKEEFKYDLKENLAPLAASSGLELAADISGDRDVSAIFAEMAFPFTRTIEATLALRYDNYSDFGGTFNPKIGVKWKPEKGMLFRGSYNTGFRAPTLYDIYQPIANTFTTDSYNDPVLCPTGTPVGGAPDSVVCDQQVQQRLSGPAATGKPVDSLKPEESETFSVGFVFEPTTNLFFSVDYWNIKIENLISTVPEQAIFGDPTKYASRIIRCGALNPAERSLIDVCANFSASLDPIAYIDSPTENLGEVKTSGFDFSAAWRGDATAYGRFGVAFDGTYIQKYDYQREKNGTFIEAAGRYTDNAPVFRWQHVLTFSWTAGGWGVAVAQNYKTGYTDQDPSNEVRPYQLWDATMTYTGVKNLTLMFGVRNLNNETPPYSNQATTFQSNYDPRYTDALGRTWIARIGYKFL